MVGKESAWPAFRAVLVFPLQAVAADLIDFADSVGWLTLLFSFPFLFRLLGFFFCHYSSAFSAGFSAAGFCSLPASCLACFWFRLRFTCPSFLTSFSVLYKLASKLTSWEPNLFIMLLIITSSSFIFRFCARAFLSSSLPGVVPTPLTSPFISLLPSRGFSFFSEMSSSILTCTSGHIRPFASFPVSQPALICLRQ